MGKAYAIDAVMCSDDPRKESDNGGQTVWDRNEDNNRGGCRLSIAACCFGLTSKQYRERSWASVIVRKCGKLYAIADIMPLEDGGCVYWWTKILASRCSSYMPKWPSANPTATLILSFSSLWTSIARAVGALSLTRVASSLSRQAVAMSFCSPLKLHARSPAVQSTVNTTPLCNLTSRGGTGGCSATWISLISHLPWDQLWRSLYCLFQFGFLPSLTKWLSSSHLDPLDEYVRLRTKPSLSLMPGIREARGRTKRL